MTSKTETNGQLADDILNAAKAKAATASEQPATKEAPKTKKHVSSSSDAAITKASTQTSEAGTAAIQQYNNTQKQIDALEIKKGLEKGQRSAKRMAEAEQVGFVKALTEYRVQNAKSRFTGLDAIEQRIDEELGTSEHFQAILGGESDTDPLEQINELMAEVSPSSDMTPDLFSLLDSDSISK